MDFLNYYFTEAKPLPQKSVVDPNAWRERRVFHFTKTGKRNKIKIKYLPADEQMKYAPQWYKNYLAKRRAEAEAEGKDPNDIQVKVTDDKIKKSKKSSVNVPSGTDVNINPYTMDFYYAVSDPEKFNVFSEESRIIATTSASATREWEDSGKYVAEVMYVPMDAIVAYKNEEDEWINYEEMEDEEKFDKIKFSDIVWFKLNVFPYLDTLRFELLTDLEGDREKEIKDRNKVEEESGILNNLKNLLEEDNDSDLKRIGKEIANQLKIRFDGMVDVSSLPELSDNNIFQFTDHKKTGSTFIVKVPLEIEFNKLYDFVKEKLINMRRSFEMA